MNGDLAHFRTRRDWIAFRRWVTQRRTSTSESFRVLGAIDHTWDWPHVELPSASLDFDTVEAAVARARRCLAPGATLPCNFPPHLPARLGHPLVR